MSQPLDQTLIVAQRVLAQLQSRQDGQQVAAIESIRDLGAEGQLRLALLDVGAVQPLLELLDADVPLAIKAAQALRALFEEDGVRIQFSEFGGSIKFVELTKGSHAQNSELLVAVLQAALALAADEASCLALHKADALAATIKLVESSDDMGVVEEACLLLGRLGQIKLIKNSIREQGGLAQMLRHLQGASCPPRLVQVIVEALKTLVIENEINQDYIREHKGIAPLINHLDVRGGLVLSGSAATCLTALCINNDANKTQLRELWAIPLLVTLLEQEDVGLQEKAVDCLRILTTGNDLNQLSLFSIPAGVRNLVRIMTQHKTHEAITERAAAVIGNMSSTKQFFSAIRECGGLQRLVILLDSGPESLVTEIAAKALANMAGNDSSRKGIRLAGGLPPLISLLTQRPSEQVLLATEEALRRLQVTNDERNAILETLRYCEQRHQAEQTAHGTEVPDKQPCGAQAPDRARPHPLTQYTVQEACDLLNRLGILNTHVFVENGVNGADLLELSPEDLTDHLHLSHLQARKIQNVQQAFKAFEAISMNPGKAEITQFELREWLTNEQKRSSEEVQSIVDGFKRALSQDALPLVGFENFAVNYQWLAKTLQVMTLANGDS